MEGRAYLLRPDTPLEGRVREARPGETADELADPLRSQARAANLVMRPPRYTPNSLNSLQATEYAQEQGKFLEYHRAAYAAYWDARADLGDPSVLAEIGAGVGLDGAELRARVESGHYAQQVVNQYHEALGYGISGIPTFVFDNLLFTGAQPYEVFQRVMDKALENRAAASASEPTAGPAAEPAPSS